MYEKSSSQFVEKSLTFKNVLVFWDFYLFFVFFLIFSVFKTKQTIFVILNATKA